MNSGLSVLSGAAMQSSRLLLEENLGRVGCGGILTEASLKLIDSRVRKNHGLYGYSWDESAGGAFFVHANSELHLIDTKVTENAAFHASGIAVTTGSRLIMQRSAINNNHPVSPNYNDPTWGEVCTSGG